VVAKRRSWQWPYDPCDKISIFSKSIDLIYNFLTLDPESLKSQYWNATSGRNEINPFHFGVFVFSMYQPSVGRHEINKETGSIRAFAPPYSTSKVLSRGKNKEMKLMQLLSPFQVPIRQHSKA
jgi:hypothetical protein